MPSSQEKRYNMEIIIMAMHKNSNYTFQDQRSEVKVALLFLILCDPMHYTVHGILQARILEWVAFFFSGDLPNPGIEPRSPTLQSDSLPAEPQGKPFKGTPGDK